MPAGVRIIAVIYIFALAGIIALADSCGTSYFAFIGLLPFGDKIGHFCLMGVFSLVVNLAFEARTIHVWKLNYLFGSLIVLAVVIVEEFSQIYVSERTFDSVDLLADAAGIFIFGEIARFVVIKKFNFSHR